MLFARIHSEISKKPTTKKKPGSAINTLKDKLLLDSPERLVVNTGCAVFPNNQEVRH